MRHNYLSVSCAAALAAAVLSLPAHGVEDAGHATTVAAAQAPAPAQALPSQRAPGNGGLRHPVPAASAASRAGADGSVQSTTSDGRRETRGAGERNATSAAQTPND